MLGVFAMLYLVALVVSEYYTGNYKPGPIKPKPEHFTDVFLAIPSLCFGYQCHFSVIPIYSCMKTRSVKSFAFVTSIAMAISVAFYTLTAVFGYLTFGGSVNEDILMSFEGSGPVYAGMYIMVLKIITVSNHTLMPIREILAKYAALIFYIYKHLTTKVSSFLDRLIQYFYFVEEKL